MKCTCPTPAPCVGDPTPLIFHLLALGVGVGVMQFLAFLDTNMVVFMLGLSHRECFRVAVEYRL